MNTELSPQIRSLVSGLAAIAATTLLMTSLVESFEPLPRLSSGELSTPRTPHVVFVTTEEVRTF